MAIETDKHTDTAVSSTPEGYMNSCDICRDKNHPKPNINIHLLVKSRASNMNATPEK